MSPTETPPPADSDRMASVFRAFAIEGFQAWPAWRRLQLILSSNGGSYGLVGPRGAGKTWLMMRAVEEADDSGGIGLWFPSPSEYDPQAFLSTLSDNFAAEIERRFRERHPLARTLFRLQSPWVALVLACVLFFLYLTLIDAWPGLAVPASATWPYFAAAALAIVTAFALATLSGAAARNNAAGAVIAQARELQERIRYSSTLTQGTQAGAGHGLFHLTRSSQRELLERPTTTSSLVHDFRRLGRDAATVIGTSRVVIALDELDKMVEPEKVRALLRDIKGIFEIEGVHFLVSVSHEAARVLKLGGLAERNEFNSSFYTVIDLPPLLPGECTKLLKVREQLGRRDRLQWLETQLGAAKHSGDVDMKRDRDRLRAAVDQPPETTGEQRRRWVAIGVLAGGNPRETIRLADVADERRDDADPDPARAAIAAILRAELLELRREALAAVNGNGTIRLSDEELRRMYDTVNKLVSGDASLLAGASTALAELWSPSWAGYAWRTLLGEEWQRLVIRLQVGGLMSRPDELDDEALERLAEVVAEASLSASAAKLRLDGGG